MPNRLAEGVWELGVGLFPPLASNAYLVDEGDEVTLLDTGLPYNRPSLRAELRAAGDGYVPTDLDRVLLTHYDLDHTGGLPGLRESGFEGTVHVGEADARLARGEDHPPTAHPKGLFHRLVRPFFSLPEDVERVRDGDRVGGFTAYHTPGHNPGHTVYVHDGLGVAFLGDLVWVEGGTLTPPFWLDSYDMYQLRESIRSFAERAPPFEVACPGHGRPLTEGGREALAGLAARL
jgi:glyoxylase-like metal-dependent hydrolase (beta-lactamase superfamily II)